MGRAARHDEELEPPLMSCREVAASARRREDSAPAIDPAGPARGACELESSPRFRGPIRHSNRPIKIVIVSVRTALASPAECAAACTVAHGETSARCGLPGGCGVSPLACIIRL